MNKTAIVVTLFGVGMLMVGYGVGCLKTRGEFMEALARASLETLSKTSNNYSH